MKAEGLAPEFFIHQSINHLVIDVRAPIEYRKGHIPEAINIPLFDDEERAEIGTLYKLKGKQPAIARGYELVNPKLQQWIDLIKQIASNKKVFVYCFRGGMRSNSFAWWLNENKISAQILTGGYKAYRQTVLNRFAQTQNLVLLGGATGSRKTDVLRYIQTHQLAPVIDLEKLANHKGSAFGAIGEKEQQPQQIFENTFFNALQCLTAPFLLEDESMAIGFNKIPYTFWLQMKEAPLIILDVPFELRLKKIMEDYSHAPITVLTAAIHKISEQLGGQLAKTCLELLNKNDILSTAEIVLKHYDKAYAHSYNKKKNKKIMLQTNTDDIAFNSQLIVNAFNSLWKPLN
jgi:tRNA 2-selenouridine synthase